MRSAQLLWLMNDLPPPVHLGNPPSPLDLSKATKLRDVGFRFGTSSVQWISIMLRSARLDTLRRINIVIFPGAFFTATEEVDRGWQELDQLLVWLWTSHSVIPKVTYERVPGEFTLNLFPELANRGVVWATQRYLHSEPERW